jgi:hypothetical protein
MQSLPTQTNQKSAVTALAMAIGAIFAIGEELLQMNNDDGTLIFYAGLSDV